MNPDTSDKDQVLKASCILRLLLRSDCSDVSWWQELDLEALSAALEGLGKVSSFPKPRNSRIGFLFEFCFVLNYGILFP